MTSGGATGWSINRDGTATFNTTGGSFQITPNGLFFYTPAAGSGTLIASFANTAGVDQYGNSYDAGFFLNQKQAHLTGDGSDTVMINPNGAVGPQLLFAESGSGFASTIYQFANTLRMEAANASGATLLLNMPVRATGGLQGSASSPASQPSWGTTGSFVDFTHAQWSELTIVCPPSETIAVHINNTGFNNASTASTLTVGIRVKDGATTLIVPDQFGNGAVVSPEGAAAGNTSLHQKTRLYVIGQDILAGLAGHTITVIPSWRISSGSAATSSIDNTASITVNPCLFTQFQSG